MQKISDDLAVALEGEVLGEASFRSGYYASVFSRRKPVVKALWQLEAQTKHRIIKYLHDNHIEAPKYTGAAVKGTAMGLFFPIAPWRQILQQTLEETQRYLTVFHRMEAQADAKDKPLFAYIVAHELAIQRFAEIELGDSGEDSLAPILALLDT